ncbi:YtxH domain-containing protein [Gordonia sp. CPCC 205515]|uniref:YtxH domain-containing protein n=1 Tax=Gordonia sp. CPCC 205515 TaxID=3140791 RepID=UPI003AF36779
MQPATPDRSPGLATRVAAGVVVPFVAVAAHGLAADELPSTSGMLLTATIGVLVGVTLGGGRRQSLPAAIGSTTALLTAAQIGAHVALMVGGNSSGMIMHHDAWLPMLLTHVIAIPLSAVLIVAAATVLARITSTIRSLIPPRGVDAPPAVAVRWFPPYITSSVIVGSVGVRGPPVSA